MFWIDLLYGYMVWLNGMFNLYNWFGIYLFFLKIVKLYIFVNKKGKFLIKFLELMCGI